MITARIMVPVLCLLGGLGMAAASTAATFELDSPETELVGELRYEHARRSDMLMDIARWLNMGYREIRRANPDVDLWVPGEGSRILIPSLYVLPDAPREGIVINRAEKRLYYFHRDQQTGQQRVTTHPIGIGRAGRETPTGTARVIQKLEDPAWYPTEGVRADYRSRGIDLPRVIPPGPENPLGRFAMVLDMDGYLIHGTHRPDGVGMRVSQGCIRLYPEHIESLIYEVPLGTPVRIVDQPIKTGLKDGQLYLEIHAGVDETVPGESDVRRAMEKAWTRYRSRLEGEVDWEAVEQIRQRGDGVPRVIAGTVRED